MSHDETERESQDEKERVLRDRIFEQPSLLPGFDGPTAAAKEVQIRRAGPADVVVVNAKGKIAIVECKRASNPECRRTVIGQAFEYAAGLWKCKCEDLERMFAACGTELTEPFEDDAGWDETTFRNAVDQTLKEGDFRVFIAVDEMTERLKRRLVRTVTFLNSRLPTEVEFLAVALPRGGDPESPYGGDRNAIPRLPPRTPQSKLIAQISTPEAADAAAELFDWAERMESRGVEVRCRTKKQCVIQMPNARPDGKTARLLRVRPEEVRVSLGAVVTKHKPWDERTKQFVRGLDEIGVRLGKDDRPTAPLELLADEGTRATFLHLMEQHLENIEKLTG